jgi:phage/plasmid-associated DNA primase
MKHDLLSHFLEERCIQTATARIEKDTLYAAYKEWASEAGYEPLARNIFGEKLHHDFDEKRTKASRFWVGLSLRGQPRGRAKSKLDPGRAPLADPRNRKRSVTCVTPKPAKNAAAKGVVTKGDRQLHKLLHINPSRETLCKTVSPVSLCHPQKKAQRASRAVNFNRANLAAEEGSLKQGR